MASKGTDFDGHNEGWVVGPFAEQFRLDWAAIPSSKGAHSDGHNENLIHRIFTSRRLTKVDLLAMMHP